LMWEQKMLTGKCQPRNEAVQTQEIRRKIGGIHENDLRKSK